MIHVRKSQDVPKPSAIVNLYQRHIQVAIFMNVPLKSVAASPYANCRNSYYQLEW